jgi:NAD(P)H-nitrite reductase large subunit
MAITKCVCFNCSFEHLKEVAEKSGVTSLEGLKTQVTFALSCKMCIPYVEKMLQPGEVRFEPQKRPS